MILNPSISLIKLSLVNYYYYYLIIIVIIIIIIIVYTPCIDNNAGHLTAVASAGSEVSAVLSAVSPSPFNFFSSGGHGVPLKNPSCPTKS